MLSALVLIASSVAGAPFVLAPDVVRITPSEALPVELVSQKLSDDGKALTLTFSAAKGSFYVGLDFSGTEYQTVTIVVKDSKDWISVDYYGNLERRAPVIDLLRIKGVTVSRQGKDCVIVFGARAARILPPTGTLRYLVRSE